MRLYNVASLTQRIDQLDFDLETEVEQVVHKVKSVIEDLGELQSLVESISDKMTQTEQAQESLTRETTAVLDRRIEDLEDKMDDLYSAQCTCCHAQKLFSTVQRENANSSDVDRFCNSLKKEE